MNTEYHSDTDTIAAPATPPGRGGIAVIRCSGGNSRTVCSLLFDRPFPTAGQHRFVNIVDPPTQPHRIIDTAVISFFAAPHSYTGEDVVEISLHGSPVIVSEVLGLLYSYGVRPANPGEFTLRAFLNGQLDLTQAEAVADIIAADSREAADQAIRQLRGGLGTAIDNIHEDVLKLLVLCESELDFPEEDIRFESDDTKLYIVDTTLTALSKLTDGYQVARHLREGVKVALVGVPNVGKSSLFNALLGDNRAIVHPSSRTTRDVLTGSTIIGGIRFDLFDTAGLRVTDNEIEDEGVRRAKETAFKADIVLVINAVGISETPKEYTPANASVIRILNKCDLIADSITTDLLTVSAKYGTGIQTLRDVLVSSVTGGSVTPGIITRERHYNAVNDAIQALSHTRNALRNKQTTDIVAEELRAALASLDSITGLGRGEAVLDSIFSQFCIGK